jgi:hypothetical protein
MPEIVFVLVVIAILGVLIWLSYKSKQKRFPFMFAVAALCFCAFYLFQYGNFFSVNLKPFSSEANFIREKKKQVIQDVKEIKKAKAEILAIKKRLQQTTTPVSPPTLKLTGRDTQTVDSGYCLTLQFTPSNNTPLESLEFTATVDDDSDVRILNFWPSVKGGSFAASKDSKQITRDGRRARLSYSPLSVGKPAVDITLSEKARIRIEGNCLKDAVIVSPE